MVLKTKERKLSLVITSSESLRVDRLQVHQLQSCWADCDKDGKVQWCR